VNVVVVKTTTTSNFSKNLLTSPKVCAIIVLQGSHLYEQKGGNATMPRKKKITTFGDFVREKRMEKGMTARELAKALGISPVYMCDIEKNRSCAIDELLDKLILILALDESGTRQMYDLVAIARKSVSPDLHNYIMGRQLVQTALREANKHQIPDEKWEQFIREITAKEDE